MFHTVHCHQSNHTALNPTNIFADVLYYNICKLIKRVSIPHGIMVRDSYKRKTVSTQQTRDLLRNRLHFHWTSFSTVYTFNMYKPCSALYNLIRIPDDDSMIDRNISLVYRYCNIEYLIIYSAFCWVECCVISVLLAQFFAAEWTLVCYKVWQNFPNVFAFCWHTYLQCL